MSDISPFSPARVSVSIAQVGPGQPTQGPAQAPPIQQPPPVQSLMHTSDPLGDRIAGGFGIGVGLFCLGGAFGGFFGSIGFFGALCFGLLGIVGLLLGAALLYRSFNPPPEPTINITNITINNGEEEEEPVVAPPPVDEEPVPPPPPLVPEEEPDEVDEEPPAVVPENDEPPPVLVSA